MLNQVVLVGRLVSDPELLKSENGKEYARICVAVPRSFKNAEGEYETDFLNCSLWDAVAKSTAEYCKKGDIVGVKGRIQTSNYEKDGETKYSMEVVTERITFLSSKSQDHDKKEKEHEDRG